MNDVPDYYAALGLTPGTSIPEVKVRFRQLALVVHPDCNGDDPECLERLKQINAAYEFLSEPIRKAAYDVRCRPTPNRTPRPSASPPSPRSPGDIAAPAVMLGVFCIVLLGLVAFLVLGGLSQPSGAAAPPANTALIELTPDATEPASDAVAPLSAHPAADAGRLPAPGKSLWPAASTEPPTAVSGPNDVSPASATSGEGWPSSATGSFPSH